MTTRGRITIPKEIRDALKLKPGSQVSFFVNRSGHVEMRALTSDFRVHAGIVKSPHKRALSIKEIDEAIGAAVAERYRRSVRR